MTREQIERRNPSQMTDIMRMVPGVRIISRGVEATRFASGSRCPPLVWLDGFPLTAGDSTSMPSLRPRWRSGDLQRNGEPPLGVTAARSAQSACGTIVMWSRQGELRPKKRKGPSAAQRSRAGRFAPRLTADQWTRPRTKTRSSGCSRSIPTRCSTRRWAATCLWSSSCCRTARSTWSRSTSSRHRAPRSRKRCGGAARCHVRSGDPAGTAGAAGGAAAVSVRAGSGAARRRGRKGGGVTGGSW